MMIEDIRFSVNRYDRDGYCIDNGIFLHFGDTMVKVTKTFGDFKTIVNHMKKIVQEIEENYIL